MGSGESFSHLLVPSYLRLFLLFTVLPEKQSLFTKITDAVPVHNKLQVMTEASEINNVLLKSGAAPTLLETLKDAGNLDYFQSLIVRLTFTVYSVNSDSK